MEKDNIKQHGRDFIVNGIRKIGFLGVILLCSTGVSLAQEKKESKTDTTGMKSVWDQD